jgi:carboxypeptidase PM20D1
MASVAVGGLGLLAAALSIHVTSLPSRQRAVPPVPPLAVDIDAASARLAAGLRFHTITHDDASRFDEEAFARFRAHLATSFPHVHRAMTLEVVNGHALLFRWQGSNALARPALFMAHQDVVPVAPGTEGDWHVPPFAGVVRGGFIWGRGAWDDKGNLMAMLEAAERLIAQGHVPDRTIFLALGHDEEAGGTHGSKAIAEVLRARGVRLSFVLDEGMMVTQGMFAGIDRPLALVGTAEKGYAMVRLRTHAEPGHSSAPVRDGAVARLSAALAKLDANPMPARIDGPTADLLDTLAPETPLASRVVLANRWLFGPLLERQLAGKPATDAMLRSTMAFTRLRAGNKENVLPGEAEALVNVRLLPGDTVDDVIAHMRAAIDDPRVEIRLASPPFARVPPMAMNSAGYRLLEKSTRQVFADSLVAPVLVIGGTDSRHFAPIADEIYRFSPVRAAPEDLARYHGTDERISVANYAEMIRFYVQCLRNLPDLGTTASP